MDVDARRDELEAWLILLRAPQIGPATLRALIARHGDAVSALRSARRGGARGDADNLAWLRRPDRAVLDTDLAWLARDGCCLLAFTDVDFPPLANEIPSPPAALFVRGQAALLWQPQLAVVGSRSASHAGLATATAFARALAGAGLAVTSGLADGIDGAAHAAALDGGGTTIAVLGTGADRVYPRRHRELAARIAENGALVSEFPPGTPARADHFPRRNRIIAGLSLGTLVVEAGLRSGSLITAGCAADAGREVFALPGSIHNPLAQRLGCALRARLGEHAADSAATALPQPVPASPEQAPDRNGLLAALGHETLGVDELAERAGVAVANVSSALLMLELEGAVVAAGGGRYVRRV